MTTDDQLALFGAYIYNAVGEINVVNMSYYDVAKYNVDEFEC